MLTNEVIHEVSEQITNSDDVITLIQELRDNLTTTAVGIAAPQIGVLKRVILCKINGVWIPMINPIWIARCFDKKQSKEGCLSFPDKFVKKQRFYRIWVTYQDELMQKQEISLSGLASYIVQHECDHLDGVTIC
jgi:peptide deformylase